MAITAVDIKDAAFTSIFADIEELNLSNRGAVDAGALAKVPNLTSLNLSFNALTSAHGLTHLVNLSNLNLSHNQLTSLKGLPALTALTVVNLASNKISSLAPLSACLGLKDLWLQQNQIKGVEELQHLTSLTSLNRLLLSPNPISKAIPSTQYRLAVLASCSSLQVLDAQPVSDQERTAASSFALLDFLGTFNKASTSSTAQTAASTSSTGGTPHQHGGSGSQGKKGSYSGHGSAHSASRCSPGMGAGLPGSRGMGMRMLPRKPPSAPDGDSGCGGGGARPSAYMESGKMTRTLSSSVLDVFKVPSFGSAPSSTAGSTAGSTANSIVGGLAGTRRTVGAGRRASLPLPKVTDLEGTQFQTVLDALPVFDPAKLPPKNDVPWRDAKKAPKLVVETAQSMFECRYPSAHGRAVTVRTDGSLSASWPNGDLLANVDIDHATGAFAMLAMFRSGAVAVSWHSTDGGFVQYPNGAVMLMVGSDGGGIRYGMNGAAEVRWGNGGAHEQAAPACMDVMLDAHTALSYRPDKRQLRLFWSVDDIRYEAVCGHNAPGASWDLHSGVPVVALQLLQAGAAPRGTKRGDVQGRMISQTMPGSSTLTLPAGAMGLQRPSNAGQPVISPDKSATLSESLNGLLVGSPSLTTASDNLQTVEVS